jgi:hypothetical protein
VHEEAATCKQLLEAELDNARFVLITLGLPLLDDCLFYLLLVDPKVHSPRLMIFSLAMPLVFPFLLEMH